jgi:hypothetical protein
VRHKVRHKEGWLACGTRRGDWRVAQGGVTDVWHKEGARRGHWPVEYLPQPLQPQPPHHPPCTQRRTRTHANARAHASAQAHVRTNMFLHIHLTSVCADGEGKMGEGEVGEERDKEGRKGKGSEVKGWGSKQCTACIPCRPAQVSWIELVN